MWAATAWDDSDWDGVCARGWTVMGRLRHRQESAREALEAARADYDPNLMRAASTGEAWRASMRPSVETVWMGGPFVVALLFAHPDSDAIRTLDARGEYFDCRTGETWDLFFPGYHEASDPEMERRVGGRPVGRDFAATWFFNARDFDWFRREVEGFAEGRWRYSGGTDLVVVTGDMPGEGEITFDWNSTVTGSLTEADGTRTLTVAQVIERLSANLESEADDPAQGLEAVVTRELAKAERKAARDIVVGALAEVAAALAKAGIGL
jgi:hypothetical protein